MHSEHQTFDLLRWANEHRLSIAEIMALLNLDATNNLADAGRALYQVTPQQVVKLPGTSHQQLVQLFAGLGFFDGVPLPDHLESPTILVPGQPFLLAVEILRPLIGHDITCIGSCIPYDPKVEGSPQDIAQTFAQFKGTRWHSWFNKPQQRQPLEDQYELMGLAVMVASEGKYDLQAVSADRITHQSRKKSIFTHLGTLDDKVLIYARYGFGSSESKDIRRWMQLVNDNEHRFDTSSSVVIATSPLTVQRVGYHAQKTIQSAWPDCDVYVTAPAITLEDWYFELPTAINALGGQMQYAVYGLDDVQG